jgi:hypothetical protein
MKVHTIAGTCIQLMQNFSRFAHNFLRKANTILLLLLSLTDKCFRCENLLIIKLIRKMGLLTD